MSTPFAVADWNEPFKAALQRVVLGNTLESWLIAACVFVGATLILGVIKRLVQHRLAKIAERTDTDLDDLLVDLVKRTRRYFLIVLALFIAQHWIEWPHESVEDPATHVVRLVARYQNYFHTLVLLVVWLQVGLWARGILAYGVAHISAGKGANDPARTMGTTVLSFVGEFVIWSLVLLQFLSSIDFPVASLIASLGVGGIAVALAAQNILGDLFASITILLDKPFVVGDAIQVGDFNGTVEHIGVKTTRLRSVNGEQIVMGNNDLVSSRIRNFKRLLERRVTLRVGVTYETPHAVVAQVPAMLRKIVEARTDARFERAHLASFGESAIVFELVYFATRPEYNAMMDMQESINLSIHALFEREGIQFAYPTQTVHVVREKSARGGAAAADRDQNELSRG